jgi:CRP-like cAMP-binding protein
VTDRLAAMVEEEHVGANESVFVEGDASDHFYLVRQGRLRLTRGGRLLEVIDGPRAIGILDALAQRPRSVTAVASTPLDALRVPIDPWLELTEDSFGLARMQFLGLARSVAALEQRLWESGRALARPGPRAPVTAGARLDLLDRVAALTRTRLMHRAGVRPIGDLAATCAEVELAAGERLFGPGTPRDIVVVVAGEVEARRVAPVVVWRGGPGEMVCDVVPFTEVPSTWEATALVPTRVLTFRIEDWFDVLEENFGMLRATLVALATEREHLLEMV